jgi:hypothetical protein
VRAEFFRPDDLESPVAVAEWDGARVHPGLDPDALLDRVFRVSPVVVDDHSLRPQGSQGPVVVEVGDLDWFRMAALHRSAEEGLQVRLVSDRPGGWDPAGAYRRLGDWVGDRESRPGVTHPVSWR